MYTVGFTICEPICSLFVYQREVATVEIYNRLTTSALSLHVLRSEFLFGFARQILGARNHRSIAACFEATQRSELLLEQAAVYLEGS